MAKKGLNLMNIITQTHIDYSSLKSWMKHSDITQAELADRINTPPSTVSYYLSDGKPMPIQLANRIQFELNIPDGRYKEFFATYKEAI